MPFDSLLLIDCWSELTREVADGNLLDRGSASQRVSYSDVNVIRGFAKLKVPRNEPFNGSLTVGEIGSIGVSRIESDPFEIQRSRKEIAHSHADDYFIHLQCAGQSTHLQGDCETPIKEGEFFLVDLRRPFTGCLQTRGFCALWTRKTPWRGWPSAS